MDESLTREIARKILIFPQAQYFKSLGHEIEFIGSQTLKSKKYIIQMM